MLIDRIMGAFTFKKGIYSQTANDTSFTNTAWIIVLIVEFLNQLGQHGGRITSGFFGWLVSGVILGVLGLGAFALACFLVAWLANNMFKATATFKQVVRALGLAYVWRVIGLIGIIGVIPFLGCLLAPITILAGLAGLAADLFAIKESTNMDWTGTVVTAVVAVVITLAVTGIAALILAIIGLL
jgi:hypothetical protein